jgi:hypothetical protein
MGVIDSEKVGFAPIKSNKKKPVLSGFVTVYE